MVKKILDCQARKQIAHFFHSNPSSVDTAKGIAAWTGLGKKELAKALKELVKMGVLIAYHTRSTVGYAYTKNKALIRKINKYFS